MPGAGDVPTLRERRLATDAERVRNLAAANPGRLDIKAVVGAPPHQYDILLECRSVLRLRSGRPVYGDAHTLRVVLPSGYPLEEPARASVLTPIFHPHVFKGSNVVCVGTQRTVSEFLDAFVRRMFDVLRFDPQYLNPNSPANREAMEWAAKSGHLFPLDPAGLRLAGGGDVLAPPAIVWVDRA
jgi:ubiquitin-protein ligase